jgi:hypothetical protein
MEKRIIYGNCSSSWEVSRCNLEISTSTLLEFILFPACMNQGGNSLVPLPYGLFKAAVSVSGHATLECGMFTNEFKIICKEVVVA